MNPDDEKKRREAERRLVEAILNSNGHDLDKHLVQLLVICQKQLRYFSKKFGMAEDDILQELVLRLCENCWERLRGFRGQSSLSTWISTIVFRLCVNLAKKAKRGPRVGALEPTVEDKNTTETPHDEDLKPLQDGYSVSDLREALVKLSESDQFLLKAFHFENLEVDTIASLLEETPNNVRVRLHRARKRLREILEEQQND